MHLKGTICIIVPDFVEIDHTVAEITFLRFFSVKCKNSLDARYDTINQFNVRLKGDISQFNLPRWNNTVTENWKKKKKLKMVMIALNMAQLCQSYR